MCRRGHICPMTLCAYRERSIGHQRGLLQLPHFHNTTLCALLWSVGFTELDISPCEQHTRRHVIPFSRRREEKCNIIKKKAKHLRSIKIVKRRDINRKLALCSSCCTDTTDNKGFHRYNVTAGIKRVSGNDYF